MKLFNHYASYYDLLYKDKDYSTEVEYVLGLLQANEHDCQTILELGCGTGGHAELLAQEGISVHGIDLSLEMIKKAEARKTALSSDIADRLSFNQGDIRTYRDGQTYDAVISLFHVMSYQTTNEDLLAAFKTAQDHLKPGGIFLFDCWYGPAVLTDPPTIRIKRIQDDHISVTRLAEPVMHANENCVDVNYTIIMKDKQTGNVEEITESHKMRYLFKPEIELMLESQGLTMSYARQWLSGDELNYASWNGCFVGRRQK